MEQLIRTKLTRRQLQKLSIALPAPLALAAIGFRTPGIAFAQTDDATETVEAEATAALAPTPACLDDDDLETTLEQTEGPFYTTDTPERTSFLEPGITGTTLVVSGYVYSTGCEPIAGAFLDFWHCDDTGAYDNVGYKLRGHQFADADGRFELETIVPAVYSGRTRHIHVKVQAPDQPELTTQLYWPDEPENDSDGIFDPALVMDVEETDDGQRGFFNFVLAV